MKKIIILIFVVFGYIGVNGQCPDNSPDFPLVSYSSGDAYSWTAGLYSLSQIGGAGPITQLTIRIDNPSYVNESYSNQYIYLRHTSTTNYPSGSPYPGTSGFTLVWSGTINFNHTGYFNIGITTFNYNGTDNLEILWENHRGSSPSDDVWFDRTAASSTYNNGKFGSGWSWTAAKNDKTRRQSNTAFGFNTTNSVDCRSFQTTLPVALIQFNTKKEKNNVQLTWTTVSEINNNYFTVEHSTNGVNFKQIGRIKGAGNSNSAINYSFTDKNLLTKNNYYRLKQTDFNGEFTYSEIKSINFGLNELNNFKVYPNPAKSFLFVESLNSINSTLEILDITGRNIKNINIENIKTKIDISNLNKGIYFAKIKTIDNTQIIRFSKE